MSKFGESMFGFAGYQGKILRMFFGYRDLERSKGSLALCSETLVEIVKFDSIHFSPSVHCTTNSEDHTQLPLEPVTIFRFEMKSTRHGRDPARSTHPIDKSPKSCLISQTTFGHARRLSWITSPPEDNCREPFDEHKSFFRTNGQISVPLAPTSAVGKPVAA